jgi:two-component system phosphate regulon response regulator PhoB
MHRLEKEGMEVVHFQDGEAAYEAVSEGRVALAILDVNLPGMSGFELLQRARELPHFRRTPVIMLTAMGRETDVVRGLELGANDYVMKPFSPVELVARIHRILRD